MAMVPDQVPTSEDRDTLDGSPSRVKTDFVDIKFQSGVIPEVEVNGCTIRDIIQILVFRLQGFQKGTFKCRENALAITKLQEAKMWLDERERDRKAREVEGKLAP